MLYKYFTATAIVASILCNLITCLLAADVNVNTLYSLNIFPTTQNWEMKAKGILYMSSLGIGMRYYLKYTEGTSGVISEASTSNYDSVGVIGTNTALEAPLLDSGRYSLYLDSSACIGICTVNFIINHAHILDSWESKETLSFTGSESSMFIKLKRLTGKVTIESESPSDYFIISIRDGNLPSETESDIFAHNRNSYEYTFNFWEELAGNYYILIRPFTCTGTCNVVVKQDKSWLAIVGTAIGNWISSNTVLSIFIGIALGLILIIILCCLVMSYYWLWCSYVLCGICVNKCRRRRTKNYIELGEYKLNVPKTEKEENLSVEQYLDAMYVEMIRKKMFGLANDHDANTQELTLEGIEVLQNNEKLDLHSKVPEDQV